MPPAEKKSGKESPKNKLPPEKKSGKDTPKNKPPAKKEKHKDKPPCPWLCDLVPTNIPGPEEAQAVLHPRKDVFVLKVAKVDLKGDRRCKMELELVTPKGPEKKALCRIETRETQCDPDPPPCHCCGIRKKTKH